LKTQPAILSALDRIERAHGVRVLLAVESGSRAWGFASRDSDYDVRFIYAHAPEWYLSVDEHRDVIEVPISDELDLTGWDLRKALKLLRKSNPSLLEWIKSPVVYRADPAFALVFGLLASEFNSPDRLFRHYLRMASGNFRDTLRTDEVRLKKYLYVLRPLLACRWIERGLGPIPMRFQTLTDTVLADANLRFHVAVLVARKRAGEELDLGRRIPALHNFIETELTRLERITPPEPAQPDSEKLNLFFQDYCLPTAA
jgi:hypothetical protein